MNTAQVLKDAANLVEVTRERAATLASQPAYTFLTDSGLEGERLTFNELDRRARGIAVALQQHYDDGDRALLLYQPGLEYVTAFLGCLYAGVVAIPAYPPRPQQSMQRLQAIVKDARPSCLLTTTAILDTLGQNSHGFALNDIRPMATDALPSGGEDGWRMPPLTLQSLAFLQYTSGSTAAPKGVAVSHGNLLANEHMIQQAFGHAGHGSVVGWLPLYHDMGLIGMVLQPLCIGWHSILMSPLAFLQRPLRWLQAIQGYQARSSGGPNFAYDLCVARTTPEQRAALDLSCWQLAFNGSEPVRHQTLQRFAEAFAVSGFRYEAFYPCYGLAEATLFVSGGLHAAAPTTIFVDAEALERHEVILVDPARGTGRPLVSCGAPAAEATLQIVDPEHRELCPPDRVGEIWLRGPHVAHGYWNNPEATQQTFQATRTGESSGPFLRTGDLGFLHGGELYVTGRIKDLLIIDGRNHYPQDLELTVEQAHPALRPGCSAAFSVDQDGQERLVVVAELDQRAWGRQDEGPPEFERELELVRQAIRQQIAQQHDLQVTALHLLKPGSLPKTSSGKIQRYLCRSHFLKGSFDTPTS